MHSIVYMYLHGGYNLSVINTSILMVATEQNIIGVHTRDLVVVTQTGSHPGLIT